MPAVNVFGVDFGTSHCRIAGKDKTGHLRCFSDSADKHSRVLCPSAVAIESGRVTAVGWQALDIRETRPEHVISGIKKFLGRKKEEIAIDGGIIPWEVCAGKNGDAEFAVDNKNWNPVELTAKIFEYLRVLAEQTSGQVPERIVAAVPVYFGPERVRAFDKALQEAGFSHIEHISEPLAALYTAELQKGEKRKAVIDAGGGFFQASIFEIKNGRTSMEANASLPHGGDDMTALIAKRFFDDFEIQFGEEPVRRPVFRQRVMDEIERAKKALSHRGSYDLRIQGSDVLENFSKALSRYEISAITESLTEKMASVCQEALKQAGIQPGQIDEIVLSGGASRTQTLQKRIEKIFQRPAAEGINPDECVALGAARFAMTL